MADFSNLIGGLAMGISQGKQQGQQRQMMEEYRKAQTDLFKIEAKQKEAQLNLQTMQAPIYAAIAKAAGGGGDIGIPGPPPTLPSQIPGQGPAMLPNEVAPPAGNPFQPMSGNSSSSPFADLINKGIISASGAGMFSGVSPTAASGLTGLATDPMTSQVLGGPLNVTDAFRTRDQQADVYARKPNLAAPPGHSNHEKGTAFDIDPGQAEKLANAGLLDKYGFTRPMLGQGASGKNEPWHIEMTNLPQQIAQAQMPIPQLGAMPSGQQPAAPIQRNGITGQKLLEGFLKKNFGMEPDKAHVVPYGDHKLVVDDKGNPMFMIAGQGRMEMTDYTMPDGSVIKKPTLIPPSPLPGGIPVYNLAGQAGGSQNAMGKDGFMVKPPVYGFQPVKSPTGATVQQAVPQAQPGMSYQSEPSKAETQVAQGFSVADMGRMNMVLQANNRINDINSMLFPQGKVDRNLIMKAWPLSLGGVGEGTTLQSKMYQAVDSALRLETGAQANEQEIKTKMTQYWPSPKDTDSVIQKKIGDLNEYIKGVVSLADPTGEIRKMRGTPANPSTPTMGAGIPAGAIPTNRTSGGKPVYKLPNGQLWVQ